MINGIDLHSLPTKAWRKTVGYVGSGPLLFASSLLLNVTGGDADVERSRVEEVLKKSSASSFVSALPSGEDYV